MEEQYVVTRLNPPPVHFAHHSHRFTIYDFRAMRRRSYYPQNQQIVSTVTATSSSGMVASRPVTPGEPMNGRGDSIGLDNHMVPDEYKGRNSDAHHHLEVHEKDNM